MEITEISTHEVSVKYKDAKDEDERFYFKETIDGHWVLRNVVAQIDTDTGLSGYGEASHSPSILGETLESSKKAIELCAPNLKGLSPFQIAKAHDIMDRTVMRGNSAAKNAIDTAMYDLMGKALDVPVYQILGGKVRDDFPTHTGPPARSPQEIVDDMQGFREQGLEYFKLKMSGNRTEDFERVKAVLDNFGSEITVALDANQGFSKRDIMLMAHEIETYENYQQNIILEQPIDADDIDGLAELKESTTIPVLADDSVMTPEDLHKIIQKQAADIVSIKMTKAGGFYKALQMMGMASAANIPYLIDEINEFKVANTANAHLALAAPDLVYGGCTAHESLTVDIVEEGGVQVENGRATVPDAPGLGIEKFNPEYVS